MSSETSSKRRYQPAAGFDDATLARKREYWRSKKREQRARKSSTKKKIGNENLELCMSVVSEASNDPSLHYHDVSFKQEDADAPKNSFSSGLSVSESNITVVPCQKDSWFQQTKLNHVLPQLPETSTNSLEGVMGNKKIKSSDTGSSKTNATTVESVCPTVHSVPTTCIELHPNSAHAQKTKTGMLSLNGKQLAASPQSHVSIVLPVHRNQNKPQNSLRPLTSLECKVHEIQSFVHSPITKRRTCAFASEHNKGVTMTEEEMVAKRRENWRIKKREQRSKHAAKLARDQEGCLGQGQPLSVGIMHASSPANSKALSGISLNSNLVSLNQQSLGAKFDGSQITQLHVQGTKPNHASLSCGILQSSSSKSKSKMQKFAHTQMRRCQNQMRKSALGTSKVVSPEDRHARQKEYWRIKKREQRARLSRVLKTRLKERDALKHRRRHYHNSFNQACGVQVSKASAFAVYSDTIGGFIKEDGTVTVSISKTSPEASLPASQDISNVKCIGKVKLKVQVNSPLYSDDQPATKLGSAPCNISSNCINAHQNSLKSRLTRGEVMGSMTVTIQSETSTEEDRVAHLREYWRIKKREQRASRAARLENVLLRSKISVLKQREQNKKSNQRHSITSSIATKVCDSSTSAPIPIKEEHVYPTIQAVFSIPEIAPCISVKDSKPSPCPSLESHIEPPVAVDHYATTLQASMKKLLEESVYTPEENNAKEMHVKCENESLPLTKDDLLTSEDAKPSLNLQQNVSLECDFSEDTSLKDIKLSPQASTFEDTSHYKSHNVCQVATDRSRAISPVALQPQCRKTQKFSDDGADPKQSCPSQALQEQQLSESDELQRKREYWRLKKRQQRARKANKDATKHAVLYNLAQTPPKKTQSTTLMQAMSQDTSTCRPIPIQKKTSKCTKPSGPQPQPTDKSRTNRSQIVATANPQQDPEEVICRRRMQWRIKKQEQRARKAACERTLRQMMIPLQGQDAQSQNFTSLCSAVVQSITSQDQLGYLAEPCQPALKEESSFAPNHATEGPLSQAEWRNVYLMDFDPDNPLLVCMVCGEQQYSVSVEGVKAHIEEVHPDTLSLGDLEHQGILDSWDKQVAIREHFITHQLQQRCRASTVL
ncbi:uncharacterized protein LOC107679280 isoform X2 [Sinocyclocheilus anshuiensis]|uniref:uncharacterized protein LOC107679280 isoform X2 n=1 Tax=Sinocyclocheilus anshuiensis TaxID=1608454 RepID=UPI0007B96B6A|nr:PREDICTED: uncharacterized protein LOC107679280 isoform X2 [Sinocyclocheilus anshuiensis]